MKVLNITNLHPFNNFSGKTYQKTEDNQSNNSLYEKILDKTLGVVSDKFEKSLDIISPKAEKALDKTLGVVTDKFEKSLENIAPKAEKVLDNTLGKILKLPKDIEE